MEYISYCGLLFNQCPVFIATVENNEQVKDQLARGYTSDKCQFSREDMNCFGCFSEKSKDSKMCGNCTIRNCAKNQRVKNCGYCNEYPCDYIKTHVREGSENRKRLDDIKK